MKYYILTISLVGLVLFGCQEQDGQIRQSSLGQNEPSGYGSAGVSVNRLTEIKLIDSYNEYAKIDAFVDIVDSFGANIKSPGELRFELYEFKPLSTSTTGKRIYSWPVIDISDAIINQEYWQDSLRSYVFELELNTKLDPVEKYVLSVTFSNLKQQRFSDMRTIQYYEK